MRPRQWVKNGFVVTAPLFAGALDDWSGRWSTLLATAAFCAGASAGYLVNDVIDREADRTHPRKRHRPVASGRIGAPTALGMAAALVVVAMALAVASAPLVAATLGTYLVVQSLYSTVFKHTVLVDVFLISTGFLLRVLAGAAAVDVTPSDWLFVCAGSLSLLLGFGKRRSELLELADSAREHRAVLEEYSLGFLDQALAMLTGVTLVAYCVYAVEAPSDAPVVATVPWVAYGLLRYAYLVHHRHDGGNPTNMLLRDPGLAAAVAGWGITAAVVLYT